MNKFLFILSVALSFASAKVTLADQIEKEAAEGIPQGVMVKVDPATNIIEVYKVPTLDGKVRSKTASADEMANQIANTENSANKIAEFKVSKKELEGSSTEACWYGRGWGWSGYTPYSYGYNCYNPYSYPSSFSYGYSYGYRYNYSYSYGYGYNRCNYGWYY